MKNRDFGKDYLLFMLGTEEYAIDVLKIQEINSYLNMQIRPVPDAPHYVKGIAVLHENLVPIIDLRMLYQGLTVEYNEFTVVIILKTPNLMGIVVSSISEIINLTTEQIKKVSSHESVISGSSIENIGIIGQRILMILNPEKIFTQYNVKGEDLHGSTH